MESFELFTSVFSFTQCIEELILNAIDGCSSCIAIRLNWNTFSIQILDNGIGMNVEVLDDCLRPTLEISKAENDRYRSSGETLFLINQLSGRLSIVTQQMNSDVTWERIYEKQKITRNQCAPSRKSCGTTVTIEDYLYNSDQLRSELDILSQMEKIKILIDSFALLHSHISFSVRDDSTELHSFDIYQIKKHQSTMEIAEELFKLNANGKLYSFHKTSHLFKIKGLVGNQHFENCRFVYVNNRPVESAETNDLIASIFQNNGFRPNRGIILNIKCARSEYQLLIKWDQTDVKFKHWSELLRLLTSSLRAIHQYISVLELKTDQIDKWFNTMQDDSGSRSSPKIESQTLKNADTIVKAQDLYTAIKQRGAKHLTESSSKQNHLTNSKNMEISTRNRQDGETVEPHLEEKYLVQALTPLAVAELMDSDIGCTSIEIDSKYCSYGKLEETIQEMANGNQPVSRKCFPPAASTLFPVVSSLEDLQKDWLEETRPRNTPVEAICDNTANSRKPENINDMKANNDSPSERLVDCQQSLNKKRGIDNSDATCSMKVQKLESENWVRISDPNGSYFCNILSGNTCYEMPPIDRKIYEFRKKFNLKQPSINFKALNIPNEFWVNHKQPLNVSNTSNNSFPHFKATLRYCKFNKHIFESLTVIKQIDQKFICCIAEEEDQKFLVLLDQHAAHERICLEKLIELHTGKDDNGFIQIQSSPLQPHFQLTFAPNETVILQKCKDILICFGLSLTVTDEVSVLVTRVPSCFLERETSETRRGRNSVYHRLTTTLLRDIITEHLEYGRVGTCLVPQSVRNVLNSLACHGAIKFGDHLTQTQCIQLVRALAQCDVPFQCAHGRPSLTPLLDIGELTKICKDIEARPRYGRLLSLN